MPRETYRDIDFMGKKFRINKFDALTGSNVLRLFMTSRETDAKRFLGTLSTEDFERVQLACLRCCGRYEDVGGQPAAVPIMMADGRFADPDTAQDGGAVFMLTTIALSYNLTSFFDESASKEFEKMSDLLKSLGAPT